jgi:hypothetical protein
VLSVIEASVCQAYLRAWRRALIRSERQFQPSNDILRLSSLRWSSYGSSDRCHGRCTAVCGAYNRSRCDQLLCVALYVLRKSSHRLSNSTNCQMWLCACGEKKSYRPTPIEAPKIRANVVKPILALCTTYLRSKAPINTKNSVDLTSQILGCTVS